MALSELIQNRDSRWFGSGINSTINRARSIARSIRESANPQQQDYEAWVRSLGLDPETTHLGIGNFEKVPKNDINSFTSTIIEKELGELAHDSEERTIVSFPVADTSQLVPQH